MHAMKTDTVQYTRLFPRQQVISPANEPNKGCVSLSIIEEKAVMLQM